MKSRSNPTLLSFLDLLCCGLGGVLLLFMIVVVVKKTIEFGPPPVRARPHIDAVSPFVVVVTGRGRRTMFDPSTIKDSPFVLEGKPVKRLANDAWGRDYALMLLAREPDPASRLSVGPLDPDSIVEIQIHHEGEALRAETLAPVRPALDSAGCLRLLPVSSPPDTSDPSRPPDSEEIPRS